MTKIFFIRHCEAEGNTRGLLQGRSDSDISGNSAKQLDLVSLRLRNEPFDAMYSSPLKRAYKTAQAINRYHDLPIHTDERLIEIDMGEWEGESWTSIEQLDPAMLKVWYDNPGDFQAPGGESIRQVCKRMWDAVNDICQHHPDQTVCVVSHGCAIRSFLCRALGKNIDQLNDIPWCDNTAVTVVEFENGKPRVTVMNDASHIPPELSVYRRESGEGSSNIIKDIAP